MPELLTMLLDSGLMQFGRFAGSDGWEPYRLNLQWLPSYPAILRQIAEESEPLVGQVDHLLSTASALPVGLALSLCHNLPLVYSRGTNDAPVFDLVGAYDIGHPALLVAGRSRDLVGIMPLVERARRVGLEIQRAVVVMDESDPQPDGISVSALLSLPALIDALVSSGKLPEGHGKVLKDWINSRHSG